jgi:hypothetical protein
VNDLRIVAVWVEHADLEQQAGAGGSDDYVNVVLGNDSHWVAEGVQHVFVGDAVVAGRVDNPHLDNIPCLASVVRASCLREVAA